MASGRTLGLTLVSALLMGMLAARSAQAARPDAWVTAQVRVAILTTDGAGRTAVKVDTEHGLVTLHGSVRSQAEKDKAEAAARGVEGVTSVHNLVQLVPEAYKEAVKASDKDVKDAVEAALKTHKGLAGVHVESVDNGLVLLDGSTKNLPDKLVAIEAAYNCVGVRQVASKIETGE
jgi:hyperosmotically inducible periplasmic protein